MDKLSRRALFTKTAENITRIAISGSLVFGSRDAVASLLDRASRASALPSWIRAILRSLSWSWWD